MRYLILLLLLFPQLALSDDLATLIAKDASIEQKARACQRLGERGTNESVPALASLLADPILNVYARTALERIGTAQTRQAMLAALGQTEGNARIGVIQSLAAMNIKEAEESLTDLLGDEDKALVSAALHALGRMGMSEPVLAQFRHPSQDRRDLAAAVALQMKDSRLHEAILMRDVSPTYHTGARLKLALNKDRISPPELENLLNEDTTAALLAVRERPSPELANVLHQALATAKPPLTEGIVHALAVCSNEQTIPLLTANLNQSEGDSRAPYIETLSKLDAIESLLPLVGDPPIDNALIASASPRIDGVLERHLATSHESIPIIKILGQRQSPNSLPALMKAASSPTPAVQLAALESLRPLVGFNEVPQLITLYKATTEQTQKVAYRALVAASRKAPLSEVGKLLLAEADTEPRRPWLRILITLGYEPTLKTLSLDTPESIHLLAAWPNSQPIEALLALTANPKLKSATVTVILTLLETSDDAKERFTTLKTLRPSIQTLEEKRRYLAALGKTKHPDIAPLIETLAQDTTVSQEYEAARAQHQH